MKLLIKKNSYKLKLNSLYPSITDKRGSINTILNFPSKNVTIIDCKKNSIRSNHYHKTDWHFMYVLKGEFEYFFKHINLKSNKLKKIIVKRGDIIFTPPLEIHATLFTKHTTLLVISKNFRDQKTYEKDTVRVKII